MYAAFGEETSITSLTESRNGVSPLRQNKSWLSARRNKGLTIESTIFPLYFIDWCGVSRIVVRIFLHQRQRRFYAARRSEARASEPFLHFHARFPQAHDQRGGKCFSIYCTQLPTRPSDNSDSATGRNFLASLG